MMMRELIGALRPALDHWLMRYLVAIPADAVVTRYFDRIADADPSRTPMRIAEDEATSIDAKASALLTHVSMMVAASGVLLPLIASSDFERLVLLLEIACYLLIAILCLRVIAHPHSIDPADPPVNLLVEQQREVYFCRALFGHANLAAMVLTLVFFMTIPALTVYHGKG